MKSEILRLLKENDTYISGQQLCEQFQVSRTAIWKVIDQLKKEGYQIEAVRNKGYRLIESPDVMSKAEIDSLVDTKWAGKNVIYYDETDSTNNRAKEAGIDSFWYKEPLENSLLSVLDRTMAGESVYPEDTPVLKVGEALSTEFTEGELKVLRELTGGDTDEEIANTLNFSIWTVRKYVKIMLEKTGFKSRTQLAVAARESGLVIRGY